MTQSQALEAQGVILQRGDGATTEVFTEVAEVTSFNGPGGSASVVDVTHLRSTAKEKRMGLRDEGQISFECNLIPSDEAQTGLRTDRANRTLRNFKFLLTDDPGGSGSSPTTLEFSAFVLNFSISGSVDGKIAASITLEISGDVTWVAAVEGT
jgi:hypothetical protein